MTEVGATISIHLNSGSVYFIFQIYQIVSLDQISLSNYTIPIISEPPIKSWFNKIVNSFIVTI
jgi:hypothetical protein